MATHAVTSKSRGESNMSKGITRITGIVSKELSVPHTRQPSDSPEWLSRWGSGRGGCPFLGGFVVEVGRFVVVGRLRAGMFFPKDPGTASGQSSLRAGFFTAFFGGFLGFLAAFLAAFF